MRHKNTFVRRYIGALMHFYTGTLITIKSTVIALGIHIKILAWLTILLHIPKN